MDINVLVWRCRFCGCLQIKNGGLSAPSVYKPNHPGWSPFRKLHEEPPCSLRLNPSTEEALAAGSRQA